MMRPFLARTALLCLLAIAFCLAGTLRVSAAVGAPLPAGVKPEDQFKIDSLKAQESMWRRSEIAKIRYQKKLEYRASLIRGLRSELEKKRQTIVLPESNPNPQRTAQEAAGAVTSMAIWCILTVVALLVFRHLWMRAAAKDEKKSWEKFQPSDSLRAPVNRPKTVAPTSLANVRKSAPQPQPMGASLMKLNPSSRPIRS